MPVGSSIPARPKIALVCSHGGHLTELMLLADAWAEYETFWITYHSLRTSSMPHAYLVPNIGTNPFRMLRTALTVWRVLKKEKPDILVSTGAELAIPAMYLAKILGIRTIFVEVWTRVRRATGTGRLVYPVVDRFFVQWPELLDSYGSKAKLEGRLL